MKHMGTKRFEDRGKRTYQELNILMFTLMMYNPIGCYTISRIFQLYKYKSASSVLECRTSTGYRLVMKWQ